jgi:hypothetical protein
MTLVELTIRYGDYGSERKTIAVSISDNLARELMGAIELSDEPLSLLLASPGVFGGKGDAVTIRRRTFKMRREIAREIADAMVPELMKAFGVNDELDGYRICEMSNEEQEWNRRRGRL